MDAQWTGRPRSGPQRRELLRAATALAAAALLTSLFLDDRPSLLARLAPLLALFAITSVLALVQAERSLTALWSPVFWLLASCALYFGFGPLAYLFGRPEAVEQMDAYYPVSDAEFVRVAQLNVVGVALALCGAALTVGRSTAGDCASPQERQTAASEARRVWWLFLGVGGFVKLTVALPYAYGLVDNIPPGSILQLQQLIGAAILCLSYLVACGERRYLPLLLSVGAFELVTALLEFGKFAVLLGPVSALLGLALARPQARRVAAVCGVGLLGLYLLLSSFVSEGRDALARRTGSYASGSVGERLGAAADALAELRAPASPRPKPIQSWWTRLSYVNAEALAMAEYGRGRGGDSLKDAWVVLVPRVFWPAKPNITSVGGIFNAIATGSDGSASSPTVFGEGYWNAGWPGLVMVSLAVGILIGLGTRFAAAALSNGRIVFTPVLLLLVRMGLRVDGWFVTDYVGAAGIALVLGLAIQHASRRFSLGRPEMTGDVSGSRSGGRVV